MGMCGPHKVGQLGHDSRDTWATSHLCWPVGFPEPISVYFIQAVFIECLPCTETTTGSKTDACPQIAHILVEKNLTKCVDSYGSQKGSPGGGE